MLVPVTLLSALILPAWLGLGVYADPIPVTIPASLTSTYAVQSNFLGISFELSYMDIYFGNDTSTIPSTFVNYLTAMRSRTGNNPVRLRVGGNSLDSSNYDTSITTPMMSKIPGASTPDDDPVNYGPVLWDVMSKVSSDIGGANYLVGLSLLIPNSTDIPLSAGAAAEKLGDNLDGFLLGNEPDLYTPHGKRVGIQNYTTAIYMDEFQEVLNNLNSTSAGNILDKHDIGGPTLCCAWNLEALLDDGYTERFGADLKYISLQHYPQDFCHGSYRYGIPYYVQHSNAVQLASWQNAGITKVLSNQGPNKQEVIMSEFNSVSCGGVPTVSDSFGVGSLWTVDYALQLASVGYSAAYVHTREQGVTYNLFTPPTGPDGGPGAWLTGSPFYSLLVTAEALRSNNGAVVVDLNIGGSVTDATSTVSGYAIYDADDKAIHQLVLFNFANTTSSASAPASFEIPANAFPSSISNEVTVKYLSGDSLAEPTNIAWGGQTYAGVTDGKLISSSASWAPANTQVDCTQGCTINVPSPGMAVVFADGTASPNVPNKTGTTTNNGTTSLRIFLESAM
ncbi:glycoside hydrolase family 79 protein [Pholiota conissans]|uniref:Glycoside hydrolase family 79 protein n=1 Tax=Pholiota conissans TaxID=109636 RepID=A0A9P6CVJ2_9AGAR|nr:glycoside hydrolase family 79 protein [Pholiota conissans]